MADFIHETNLFGEQTVTSAGIGSEPPSTSETFAGKLIDHLRYLADVSMAEAANRADWLSSSAKAGQNATPDGMAVKQMTQPARVLSSAIVNGWQLPQLPALLGLPTLPNELKLDTNTIRTAWADDINALKNSWMATYLPPLTDMTALNALFANILNGSAQTAFELKLATLEANVTTALAAITASTLAALTSLTATVQTNIAANIATHKVNVAAALALAADNTQNIAWNRARDQTAREARRLEDEAITNFASRGFSLPAGVLAAQLQKQRQVSLMAASDAAAQQAIHIQTAFIEIAKVTVDAWQKILEAQNRTEIEQYRTITDTNLRFANLQLDANKFNVDVAFKHLGLTLDFTKFAAEEAIKYRLGVLNAMNDLIRAYAALRGNETEYLRAISLAEQQAMNALVEYYRAAIGSVEVGLNVEKLNTETAMRYVETSARFIGEAVSHYVNASAEAAKVFAQTASSALSGLHGIASVAAQG